MKTISLWLRSKPQECLMWVFCSQSANTTLLIFNFIARLNVGLDVGLDVT